MRKKRDREPVREMIRAGLTNDEIMRQQDTFTRQEVIDVRSKNKRKKLIPKTFVEEQRKKQDKANETGDRHNAELVNCDDVKVNRSCIYSAVGDTCDYIVRTGRMRGCLPQQCDRYQKRKRNRADKTNGFDI